MSHFLDSYLKKCTIDLGKPTKICFQRIGMLNKLGLIICTEPLLFCNYFKSYPGHTDANFNIAILDGHKEFVAHEKFQQMLHKVSVFLEGHSFKISNSHKKDFSITKVASKNFQSLFHVVWDDILGQCFGMILQ